MWAAILIAGLSFGSSGQDPDLGTFRLLPPLRLTLGDAPAPGEYLRAPTRGQPVDSRRAQDAGEALGDFGWGVAGAWAGIIVGGATGEFVFGATTAALTNGLTANTGTLIGLGAGAIAGGILGYLVGEKLVAHGSSGSKVALILLDVLVIPLIGFAGFFAAACSGTAATGGGSCLGGG
jgi:hypothetical protein